METNAQQAIYIAVNLFIFITLLTVALALLTSTLRISTQAGEIISDSSASYVGVIDEDLEEGYVYTYEDLLSIYVKNANNVDKLEQYKVVFEKEPLDDENSLSAYITSAGNNGLYNPIDQKDKKFSLKVIESEENGKTTVKYVFKAKP